MRDAAVAFASIATPVVDSGWLNSRSAGCASAVSPTSRVSVACSRTRTTAANRRASAVARWAAALRLAERKNSEQHRREAENHGYRQGEYGGDLRASFSCRQQGHREHHQRGDHSQRPCTHQKLPPAGRTSHRESVDLRDGLRCGSSSTCGSRARENTEGDPNWSDVVVASSLSGTRCPT